MYHSKSLSLAGDGSEGVAALHCRWLRGVGYLRPPPSRTPAAVLALTTTYLLQQLFYAYRERGDMDKLARVMFLLLCHVTSLGKQLVLARRAAAVDALLGRLAAGWAGGGAGAGAARLAEAKRRAALLLRCYAGAAVVTCLLWLVLPLLRFARAQPVEFALWMPLDYTRAPGFVATLLYTFAVTTLVGIANTTMDAFMAAVLYQSKTQLRNLREELDGLWEAARAEAVRGGEPLQRTLLRRFLWILAQRERAVEMALHMLETFGVAILVQFAIGGWILCMAAYKLVSLPVLSIEFASMCLFMTCILTELLLYCYYGNEVTVESARLATALYCTRWADAGAGAGAGAGRQFRRALLLALTAHRVVSPRAARLVPLSLDTFLKILKSSYTFYVVLRQTKQ